MRAAYVPTNGTHGYARARLETRLTYVEEIRDDVAGRGGGSDKVSYERQGDPREMDLILVPIRYKPNGKVPRALYYCKPAGIWNKARQARRVLPSNISGNIRYRVLCSTVRLLTFGAQGERGDRKRRKGRKRKSWGRRTTAFGRGWMEHVEVKSGWGECWRDGLTRWTDGERKDMR